MTNTSQPDRTLVRSLGWGSATVLVVGNVVGAGIFATSGLVAAETRATPAFLLAWALGGLFSLLGAVTYAELGAMFPRAGGDYQYLKEAYGPLAGFSLGWLYFWIISPGSIAALAVLLVDQLPLPGFWGQALARCGLGLVFVAALTMLNIRGTVLASRTQSVVTATSVGLIVGLVVLGSLFGKGDVTHFTQSADSGFGRLTGAAMTAVFFTYAGWFAATYVGSEVKRPERGVPLALVLGTLVITLLYLSVNAIYIYAMPLSDMARHTDVAKVAASRLFGGDFGALVTVAVSLCVLGCLNATILTSARVSFAMAEDRVFFAMLGKVHSRWKTPHVALIAQAFLASALVVIGVFVHNIVDGLLSYVVFAMLLASSAVGAAHVLLRIRRPMSPRPYRTPLGPVIPLAFSLSYLGFAGAMLFSRPFTSLVGLAIAASSVPFFGLWRRGCRCVD
jgi:APA family basic amino acid/polyamine antiporter